MISRRWATACGAAAAAVVASTPLGAQEDILRTLAGQEPSQLSTPLRLLALITVLSLVPSIVLMTTCFPRIVIVLSFLRRAIGTQDMPPSQIMVGLALFLTAAIMAPTWNRVYEDALEPYMEGRLSDAEAYRRTVEPLKTFMLARTLRADLRLFVELAGITAEPAVGDADGTAASQRLADLPLNVVIPAFLISELRVAFQMGFVIYLPFLIIDLVVATALISMGMMVLPPFMISLPLKVLVFVLVDGWRLTVESLVKSFGGV
jgi:flagellar biosynthetic protein FliP